jgi:L-ascorbate metabolism protein UlaG (beta-lactamase superfamily)
MRTGFFFFALFFLKPSFGYAEGLEARWLGIGGVSITDGKDTLFFDPVATKPNLKHWFFGSAFKSNPDQAQKILRETQTKNLRAIFISHTHFDHAVDAPEIARATGATMYGGPSLEVVAKAYNPEAPRFKFIGNRDVVRVGDFKITAINREHAPVLRFLGWHFLPGPVRMEFDFGFYQYREGEVWCYFVEHPLGNILLDQGSQFFEENKGYSGKVKAYFLGVANKVSMQDLVENNIGKILPKKVIPIHFDFFFLQSETLEKLRMPQNQLEEIQEKVKAGFPDAKFEIPTLYAPIAL